jgi:outer membrane lipoprotein-sorting protein
MKKLLFLFLLPCVLMAQTGKNPLEQTASKYKAMSTIRASISVTVENLKDKSVHISNGKVLIKGKKFVVSLPEQELICDGAVMTTYSPETNEAQIDKYTPAAGEISPANIFTVYETGFTTTKIEDKALMKGGNEVFDLVPLDKKRNFFKIRLVVNAKTRMIVSGKIFQKSGLNLTYSIKNIQNLPEAKDGEFAFDVKKHPGVELVDLR